MRNGTFWRIVKHRSTEDFESLPYVCTFLNSFLWTYYGVIRPAGGLLVATVNGFGVVVEIIYLILFLVYAPAKMRAKTAILIGTLDVGFLVAVILATWLALQGETRIDALGFICAGLNIIMYGSPLVAMKTVITTKSVEYMPFFLSFFFFLNGGVVDSLCLAHTRCFPWGTKRDWVSSWNNAASAICDLQKCQTSR
ncbi:Nodulin MtN3 family protein [Prunus dulcis]|uniref:Nodulin MtN3 family protein n=1 Tax=Prunus dulcis TaxID=3755 RepID=A0A4Y1QMS2_PRUDU|nr:Nodulin MtN3 family protein [Prunus dulcis]